MTSTSFYLKHAGRRPCDAFDPHLARNSEQDLLLRGHGRHIPEEFQIFIGLHGLLTMLKPENRCKIIARGSPGKPAEQAVNENFTKTGHCIF